MYFPSLQHEAAHQPEITSGIHGGYRLVSTYDLPDSTPDDGRISGICRDSVLPGRRDFPSFRNSTDPPGSSEQEVIALPADGPEGRNGSENASRGDGFRGVFGGAENVFQRMLRKCKDEKRGKNLWRKNRELRRSL